MATFTNRATLSYNNTVTNSNIAVGEILDVLSATKTAITGTYTAGDRVTYVVDIVNSGSTPVTGITVSDDLGGYAFGENTVYPLRYVENSASYSVNGAVQPAPTVTAGPPLTIGGITIPAGGSATVVYEADVTEFAPLPAASTIVNTATVTAAGLATPAIASATAAVADAPQLAISKSLSPTTVTENGQLTYTFVIQNFGSAPADASGNAVLSDTFNPVLSNITATLDGTPLTNGTLFTYDQAGGVFNTVAGAITVPAATYTQDAATGAWSVTPGTSTLVVSGTV